MTEPKPINPILKQVLEFGPTVLFFLVYLRIKGDTFTLGGRDFKLRRPTGESDRFREGDRVHLRAPADHLYLFDSTSGRTLAQAAFTDRSHA